MCDQRTIQVLLVNSPAGYKFQSSGVSTDAPTFMRNANVKPGICGDSKANQHGQFDSMGVTAPGASCPPGDDQVVDWSAEGAHLGNESWTVPDQPATPTVTVVRADQIDEFFDPTQRVTDQDRAAAVMARLRHFAERNTP
ncbi:MAG: hypothetical protein QOF70_7139 [Acetobacteraceae bacterium]|jgi:hypothetical protein|nr:hypothetical protein [Acetobacteraceae bacterium]